MDYEEQEIRNYARSFAGHDMFAVLVRRLQHEAVMTAASTRKDQLTEREEAFDLYRAFGAMESRMRAYAAEEPNE